MYEGMFGGRMLRFNDEEYAALIERFTPWNAVVVDPGFIPPELDEEDFVILKECPLCINYSSCDTCPLFVDEDDYEVCQILIKNELGHSAEAGIYEECIVWSRGYAEEAIRDIDHIRNTLLKFRKVTKEVQ